MPDPLFSGGDVTEADGYIYHRFNASGTLTKLVEGPVSVDVLVVAGGGGGGGRQGAGGGGGGGLILDEDVEVTAEETPVVVGAGGDGASISTSSPGDDGEASSFGSIEAVGGGGGGYVVGNPNGRAGGSGGGAGRASSAAVGGAPTVDQGHKGGDNDGGGNAWSGGGGGAGEVGEDGLTKAGNGGDGLEVWGEYYAGGGGSSYGMEAGTALGGAGGGGNGASLADGLHGLSGAPNSGGGGGGGGRPAAVGSTANGAGGDGGSGIVIVRYLEEQGDDDPSPPPAPPPPEVEEPTGNRIFEFLGDFTDGTVIDEGAEPVVRPDAISLNERTTFAVGPVDLQDNTQGLEVRAWRLRLVAGEVDGVDAFIARENASGTAWEAEQLLFHIAGGLPRDVSLTWGGNGDPQVFMERDGDLWVWFFDPEVGDFNLVNRGAGRSPRGYFTFPEHLPNGTAVMLYVSESLGGIAYRSLAGARYQEPELLIPLDNPERYWLQFATRAEENVNYGFVVCAAYRDPTPGRWSLRYWATDRYELVMLPDDLESEAEPLSLQVRDVVTSIEAQLDAMTVGPTPLELMIGEPVTAIELEPVAATADAEPLELTIDLPITDLGWEEPSAMESDAEPLSLAIEDIVIYAGVDGDDMESAAEPLSITIDEPE